MNFELLPRRFSIREWLILIPFFFLLWYSPYVDFHIRVATVAVGALVIIGPLFFLWRLRILRWVLIAVYAFALGFIFWPSSLPEVRADLRTQYCAALNSYLGCPYVWGGVGYFGIDCSGFVQKGLEDGLATRGLLTLNPNLLRESIWIYWHRTTAKVLGEGDHGKTYTVAKCPSLNELDYSLLLPGDLAVTASGAHVMAYLGNKTWIAADPTEGRVTKFTIPEPKNAYFFAPMTIVRWKILAG